MFLFSKPVGGHLIIPQRPHRGNPVSGTADMFGSHSSENGADEVPVHHWHALGIAAYLRVRKHMLFCPETVGGHYSTLVVFGMAVTSTSHYFLTWSLANDTSIKFAYQSHPGGRPLSGLDLATA